MNNKTISSYGLVLVVAIFFMVTTLTCSSQYIPTDSEVRQAVDDWYGPNYNVIIRERGDRLENGSYPYQVEYKRVGSYSYDRKAIIYVKKVQDNMGKYYWKVVRQKDL